MRSGGALALEEFLEKYNTICNTKNTPAVPYLFSGIKNAIESGDDMDEFNLKGTIPDLRMQRINDNMLECIVFSFGNGGFLRVIDLGYNEIGDKGAIALSKFIKVK